MAFLSSSKPLAVMAGIERRNEKRAAVSRFSPANRPPMMVEPLREAPGQNRVELRLAHVKDHAIAEDPGAGDQDIDFSPGR